MANSRALGALLLALFTLALAACSGGSNPAQPEPPADTPPSVDAGPDQRVDESAIVTLAGQVTDDSGAAATSWSQIAGLPVTLSTTTGLSPTFDAPIVGAAVTLTFRLTADDGVNTPRSDTVDVRVLDTIADSFEVDPLATDPGLTPGANHVVAPPLPTVSVPPGGESPQGKLLVFFPGTGAVPADYNDVVERFAALEDAGVAAAGIGLDYINEAAVNEICSPLGPGGGDPNCQGDIRLEILTGQDASPYVEVSEVDSIENRLSALLDFLDRTDDAYDWGDYLADGTVDWSDIVVAGHSQGGGHAAFIAKRFRVDRAVLFSATEPARWTKIPGATLASDYYGFGNTQEALFNAIANSWVNLALPGENQVVETDDWEGSGSHRLFTSLSACNGESAEPGLHQCTSSDAFTPRDIDGDPDFAPMWDFMFTDPGLPEPARDIVVGDPQHSYVDPEFLASERLATFIGASNALWTGELDPHTGLFVSGNGRDLQLDSDVAPFNSSNLNGPEFGEDEDGWAVFYAKSPLSGLDPQIFRAREDIFGVTTTQLTDGVAHTTPLADIDFDRASVQVVAVQGDDPGTGPIVTFDEAAPDEQIQVIAARDSGINAAFLPDREALVSIDDRFDGFRQLVTVDLASGARTQISFDATNKRDVQAMEDPADGNVLLVALQDLVSIGVWREDGDGFILERTLPAPSQSTLPNVRSTELFVYDGRAFAVVNVYDETLPGMGEIWVYPLDGSGGPVRCDSGAANYAEPEPLVVNGRVYIYYTDFTSLPRWGLRRCLPAL